MESILGNTRKTDIIFERSGRIDIAARVARLLNLAHGDVIDILKEEEEFYLHVKHRAPVVGRHEGMVFRSNKKGSHFRAYSRRLCSAMLRECGAKDKARLCIGSPVDSSRGTILPVITKYIL